MRGMAVFLTVRMTLVILIFVLYLIEASSVGGAAEPLVYSSTRHSAKNVLRILHLKNNLIYAMINLLINMINSYLGRKINLKVVYAILQCTWGIFQTVLGLFIFIIHIKNKHFYYHGAIVTEWQNKSSVSLGLFVFVTKEPFFAEKFIEEITVTELSSRLLVHEYGHSIQSLILGPLYLIIIGIPSTLWGFLPSLSAKRKKHHISYFIFYTERWANLLGERVTKQKSMEQLVIE